MAPPVESPWVETVRRTLTRWRDRGMGSCWVVAVSGGSDSVGLLRVLHSLGPGLGLRLSVAHLDHGVRGEAARADARFVAGLAEALGLPIDLGAWQPTRAGHFESDARRARYQWLAEVARARGATVVAVGHTRDDQAETILHRIVRGTGPRGLAGIPARRPLAEGVTLARPVLGASRDELRAFLAGLGQPYRDDASNEDQTRTRARIRHDLLPTLAAAYNPKVAEALVRLGALVGASERARRREIEALARAALRLGTTDDLRVRRASLRGLPFFTRAEVLRFLWRDAGWPEGGMDARRWRRLARLTGRAGARASIGGGIDAETDARDLILRRAHPPVPDGPTLDAHPLELPGAVAWRGGRVIATLDEGDDCDERIDRDALLGPLEVRAPRPGDRVAPLGMGGHRVSLNDFFRGRGVARAARREVPLVCDREGIVWVVGHRIAERVRRTEATVRTVGLRWESNGG